MEKRSPYVLIGAAVMLFVAAVVVTHDLDLALRHGGAMWLVAGGKLAKQGAPADVLVADATQNAFGVRVHVGTLPSGDPFAVPA